MRLHLYKLIRFCRQDRVAEFMFRGGTRALACSLPQTIRHRLLVACTFFLRAERRKLHAAFLPGFFASLSLRPAYQLKQAANTTAKVHVVAGREFFRLREETVWIHRVENQLPLEMLLAGQDKRNRFVMRVDQKQKRVVTDWLAFETENVAGVAAQEHSNTTNEG